MSATTEFTGGGLVGAVAAEWTKFWSVRSTGLALAATVVLMLGYAPAVAEASVLDGTVVMTGPDLATGAAFYLGQFLVLAVATLFVTAEYASGGIRSSLQCVPVRGRFLAAKAAVLAPVLFVVGAVLAVLAGVLAGPIRGGVGAGAGVVLAGAVGTGGYFALLGLLALGVGAALRSTAGALVAVVVLVVMLPLLLGSVAGGAALDYFPGIAGVNAMTGAGHVNPVFHTVAPYPRAVGLLICAGWAAVALLVGRTVLRRRDA
jgi:ABC-2 type transport system permease protein